MDKINIKVKTFIRDLISIILRPDMKTLPGQLAFFLVLAIFPMLGLLGYVGSSIDIFNNTFISIINNLFPTGAKEAIMSFITSNNISKTSFMFIIVGAYITSNGADSIILISNQLYKLRDKKYLMRRIKAIIITIILMFLLGLSILFLAFGNVILLYIGKISFFNDFDIIYKFFLLLKWPVAFILFFFTVKLVYTLAPDADIPSKFMNKGALFTTIGWVIMTAGYSFYVTHFTRYDIFYGSIAGVIVMMMWIYILSYIFVVGIAINKSVYDSKKHKNIIIGNNKKGVYKPDIHSNAGY